MNNTNNSAPAPTSNNPDYNALFAGGGSPLLGFNNNPLTGLPAPGPAPAGSSANGAESLAQAALQRNDSLIQSLLQRQALDQTAQLQKMAAMSGLNSLQQSSGQGLQGLSPDLQLLLQQKQLQDLQTLTLARSMGMGMNMFQNPMMMGGGLDALTLKLLQHQTVNNQDAMTRAAMLQQDQAMLPASLLNNSSNSRRKGRTGTFPQKLHQMLSDLERQEGGTVIASFLSHGRAFAIHKPRDFVKQIMPRYFRMSRFSSFQRQVSINEMVFAMLLDFL
jgi:hypothetical protein